MSQASSLFSKSKYVCALSFISAAAIFLFVILVADVYPFGDQCILRTDMYHQYAPFFSELRDKLQNGGSLKFTWDLGLGVNFVAIMAYYLASPLNILLLFINESGVIELMTVIIVIKTGLAGAAMAFYLKSHAEECGFLAYIFSLFYALSGYICAYYWNLMWLDAVYMFPIAVLGLERLLDGKSGVPYALSLGYCIFTNYYIAIVICLFLVLYFVLYSIVNTPEDLRSFAGNCVRFAVFSLLAAGLAAVLLLPEINAFKYTASSTSEFPKVYTDYFSVIAEFSRHLPMVETEQALDHWPNIYCGTGIILLFFLYISNRGIGIKEKACYIALTFFFLMSFAVNVLNFIWHGMHYPNSLPARQSFIYIFLMLYMGYRVMTNARLISKRELGRAFGLSAAFILLAQHTVNDDAIGFAAYYMALGFTAVYAGLIYLYRNDNISAASAEALLFIFVLSELSANTAYTSITTTSRKAFTADNEDVRLLNKTAAEDAGGFYRIERAQRKSKDDGAWLNFPSASIFSSMANSDCSDFYRKLGCEASTNAYSITGSTPLADMLFGIGYELSTESLPTDGINTFLAESNGMYLYKNNYALSLGLVLPKRMQSEWMTESDEPAIVQNSLCDALGTEQILVPVYNDGSSVDGECAFTVSETGLYYAYENNFDAGDITVKWSDKKKTYTNLDRSFFMELGRCEKGELITLSAEKSGEDPEIIVYRINENALRELYEKLSGCEMTVTDYSDDHVAGEITVDTGDLGYSSDRAEMLITTPYDEGWSVYVDGQEEETFKSFGTFLGFYVSGGTHQIELRYSPKGLKEGAAVSLISLAILCGIAVMARRKRSPSQKQDLNEEC